jgi:hypothetical protein
MVPLPNPFPGLLTPPSPQLPGDLQFPILLGGDLLLLPFQLTLGGHIPKGTMKTDLVGTINMTGHQTTGILQG